MFFWLFDYHLNNQSFTTNTMVKVGKPWLICGQHNLTTMTMFFFCRKTMVNFHKGYFSPFSESHVLLLSRYSYIYIFFLFILVTYSAEWPLGKCHILLLNECSVFRLLINHRLLYYNIILNCVHMAVWQLFNQHPTQVTKPNRYIMRVKPSFVWKNNANIETQFD